MIAYLIGWAFMALLVAAWCTGGRSPQGSIICVLIYCTFISFFRGDVGTDTSSYVNTFSAVAMGNQEWLFEGGFALVSTVLVAICPSPEIAVRAISVIFFALLGVYALRATNEEKWLLLCYLLPVFAYQYSMNALRIGLASSILLLCAQSLRLRVSTGNQLRMLAPVAIHYSTAISACLLLVSASMRSVRQSMVAVTIGGAITIGLVLYAGDYLFAKGDTYQETVAPTLASGTSKIVVLLILGIGVLLGDLKLGPKLLLLLPSTLLVLIGVLITRESYAGLRLLDLLSFVFPVSALLAYQRAGVSTDRFYMIAVLLAGCIGTVGVSRNLLLSSGEDGSPWVPYHFMSWKDVGWE